MSFMKTFAIAAGGAIAGAAIVNHFTDGAVVDIIKDKYLVKDIDDIEDDLEDCCCDCCECMSNFSGIARVEDNGEEFVILPKKDAADIGTTLVENLKVSEIASFQDFLNAAEVNVDAVLNAKMQNLISTPLPNDFGDVNIETEIGEDASNN